uniref:Uncharacterized protein n=1 Tax=Salix viminalis TaxID=40686 RepID=A0A6N2KJJ2_SALVM
MRLEKILHISNEKSKEQESKSNDCHGKEDFPNKIAWNLVSSKSTDLLRKTKNTAPNSLICANIDTIIISNRFD